MRILPFFQIASATLLLSVPGCDWMKKKEPPNAERVAEIAEARQDQLQDACASPIAYERLKELAFSEAGRIRNADPANLNTLATHSVVRMENPVVVSRDEALGVTVCSGRFVLELPPGAERGFGGERRLVADIEYAAQSAADGSGLVYRIRGAEPIVYKLAAFDLKSQPPLQSVLQGVLDAGEPDTAEPPIARPPATDEPEQRAEAPTPKPRPVAISPEPRQPAARASPSFNCSQARTRSERMVCGDDRLAGLDRSMATLFHSAMSDADGRTRAELRRTRDRFLAYRERCQNEACVADAYQGRMQEIRDIVDEAN